MSLCDFKGYLCDALTFDAKSLSEQHPRRHACIRTRQVEHKAFLF